MKGLAVDHFDNRDDWIKYYLLVGTLETFISNSRDTFFEKLETLYRNY